MVRSVNTFIVGCQGTGVSSKSRLPSAQTTTHWLTHQKGVYQFRYFLSQCVYQILLLSAHACMHFYGNEPKCVYQQLVVYTFRLIFIEMHTWYTPFWCVSEWTPLQSRFLSFLHQRYHLSLLERKLVINRSNYLKEKRLMQLTLALMGLATHKWNVPFSL